MLTIKELMTNEQTARKYNEIKNVIGRQQKRSAIYDINTVCNLKCNGCFYYSSKQHEVRDETEFDKIKAFILSEKAAGIEYAILIGGEPSLTLDRLTVWTDNIKCTVATNGMLKIPRERFPNLRIGISLWGEGKIEEDLKGVNAFERALDNYKGDSNAYFIYTINPKGVHQVDSVIQKIRDAGLKVYFQLFCNDLKQPGLSWTESSLEQARDAMDAALNDYPETMLSCRYYHQVLTTQMMLGRRFGWLECPAVSEKIDTRHPKPKRMLGFNSYTADLKTVHRCCTSSIRNCDVCYDGGTKMAWIIVNKREHMQHSEDFAGWIDTAHMFARLYERTNGGLMGTVSIGTPSGLRAKT